MKDDIVKEIVGIFDGRNMITNEGTVILVPSNYASKSKLVAGDTMLYRIMGDGKAFFKQITNTPRLTVLAKLVHGDMELLARATVDDEIRYFSILDSTVRYFGLETGNEVVAIIPKERFITGEDKEWASIENKI